MSRPLVTGRWVVAAAGLAGALVFANAVPLGFAHDDEVLLPLNPVVTEGRVGDALTGPYWRLEPDYGLLYRPLTSAAFVLEWRLWDGEPAGFHAVNVMAHGAASALVAALLLALVPPPAALAGALVFAVHPVHVEAVANVAGRPELWAALAFLAAVLVFLRRPASAAGRVARLGGVLLAYAVGLGGKEIAVTLPAVLVLLALHPATRPDRDERERRGALDDLPLFLGLGAVLACYMVLRIDVLGSAVGEELPAELIGTTAVERLWTALSLWPQYVRLMAFPLDLVADYGPAVLEVPAGPWPRGVGGALVLGGLAALAWATRHRLPPVSLGLVWFGVTVLPVAHVGVHAGVLLAERTLYLPSVGAAMVVGGVYAALLHRGARRRHLVVGLAVVVLAFSVRTVTRTPVWDSSFTLFRDLARVHPASHRALRLYGDVLTRSGDAEGAARAFGEAALVHPNRYAVLVEAGAAHRSAGALDRAAGYFRRASEVGPRRRGGWRLLAATRLEQGRAEDALAAAVEGLARVGNDATLRTVQSEAWVLLGDPAAAARARRAAAVGRPGGPR